MAARRLWCCVDASRQIGMGHLMRCVALAKSMGRERIPSCFIVRECEELKAIERLLRRHGYGLEIIPQGGNVLEDASRTEAIVRRGEAVTNIVVTDLCYTQMLANPAGLSQYHQLLKRLGAFVVTVDQGTGIDYVSDLIVSPYYRAEEPHYTARPGQQILTGPAYFIFREEFVTAARRERVIRPVAQRLLVTVGGIDPFHLTGKIVRALRQIERSFHVVVVVTGLSSGVRDEVEDALRGWRGTYECLVEPKHLARWMLWADLAITGEGLTKYEAAVTGTPTVTLSRFDDYEPLVREFERAGTTVHLGVGTSLTEASIAKAIGRVVDDAPLRRQMSRNGRVLVDGRGTERVTAAILEGVCG